MLITLTRPFLTVRGYMNIAVIQIHNSFMLDILGFIGGMFIWFWLALRIEEYISHRNGSDSFLDLLHKVIERYYSK